MKAALLGEFGLIARLHQLVGNPPEGVVRGIGDDAAVFTGTSDDLWLATCDAQIEGVHFLLPRTTPEKLGRRLAAVNLSDIASMGGEPTYALVALRVPPELDVAWIDRMYAGLREGLSTEGAAIIGGNTARSDGGLSMDLFLLGRVRPDRLLTRDAVRVGDVLCVTGTLGASRAGLFLLDHPDTGVSSVAAAECLSRHQTPKPQMKAGRFLAATGRVRACIDISDGLLQDAGHLAERSGVGLRIFGSRVPVDEAAAEVARMAGISPLQWALTGGEDFELLFSVPRDAADELIRQCSREPGVKITIIGEASADVQGVSVDDGDWNADMGPDGFDHLKRPVS